MRAALYTRVSTAKQAEKWSLPAQRKVLAAHAKRQGWEAILYDEGGVSGETIAGRPVFRQLLADVAAGQVDVVLVVETERLCRATDLTDWARMSTIFRDAGVLVATPERTFDLSKAEDDFEADLRGILSKREKRKLRERSARGRREAQDAGKWLGGQVPWGYRFIPGKGIEPDPELVPVVRKIFRSNKGLERLEQEFAEQGIKLHRSTIHNIRRSPFYAGLTRDSNGRLIAGRWAAIVSQEAWEQTQIAATARRAPHKAHYLLTSILRCDACGGAGEAKNVGGSNGHGERVVMYQCRSSRRHGYECPSPGSITAWVIDAFTIDAVAKHLSSRRHFETYYRAYVRELSGEGASQDRVALEAQAKELEAGLERLIDAVQTGTLSMTAVRKRVDRIERELLVVRSQLRDAARRARVQEPEPIEVLWALAQTFPEASTDQRREIIRTFTSRVAVDFGARRLTVDWRYAIGAGVTYEIPNLYALHKRYGSFKAGREWITEHALDFRCPGHCE